MNKTESLLLLNEPFGYNSGTGVKIKYHGNSKKIVEYKKFSELLLGFSCYPPAILKIYNCLKYSKEYTCFLQSTWFENSSYDLEYLLKEFDISIEVFFFTDQLTKESTEKKYNNKKKNQISTDELMNEYINKGKRNYHK